METQAPRGPAYRMADRLLDGRLAERLAFHRGAGLTFEQMGRELYNEGGVDVTASTLRAWCRHLGITTAAAILPEPTARAG